MTAPILVVGCGAIGGLFASALAKVVPVVVYDINREHVAAINRDGLRIDGDNPHTVRLAATADPATLNGQVFAAVLFLCKSKATAAALAQVRPHLSGKPLLVTMQNGMGNAEILLTAPDTPVARGPTMCAGRYVGPGHVELLRQDTTWLGPVRGGVGDIAAFAALLNAAGMTTELLPDPMGAVWSKFVFNCVMNPLGALMMGDNSARYLVPEMCALIDDMAAECSAVVTALGGAFAFPPMDYVAKTRSGAVPLSKHGGSMALDIGRGAETEIDELTGFIVREGNRLGIAVPNCRAVTRLIKGLELAAQHRVAKPR
jgi:2-dehydropantoate 2-reductase